MIDELPMEGRDTKGDLYEYMLSKIASAGQNGQFRTPRHIIALMVEMVAPTPKDEVCDPACGPCGFLIGAAEHASSPPRAPAPRSPEGRRLRRTPILRHLRLAAGLASADELR